MAGLNHDFLLVSRKENPNYDWENYFHNSKAILLHDDVLRYMEDIIKWILTYNPAKNSLSMVCVCME